MVCLKGFEPLARGLEGHCSILLSYRHILLERVKGIEPSQPAWKAGALPLSYTREWWKRLDLNQCRQSQRSYSPPPLTPRALFHIFYGAGDRNRTYNLLITSQLLCQLSHASKVKI